MAEEICTRTSVSIEEKPEAFVHPLVSTVGSESRNEDTQSDLSSEMGALLSALASSMREPAADEEPSPTTTQEEQASIYSAAKAALDEILEFRYETVQHPNGPMIRFGCRGKACSNYRFIFHCRESSQMFHMLGVIPVAVPEEQRLRACEYLTRANYGLVIGSFEFDMNDGEIRFKVSHCFRGNSTLSKEMVVQDYILSMAMMDRYFPGLMNVVYAGVEPAAALATIEVEAQRQENATGVEQ